LEKQQQNSDRNTDIGHIEDPGTETADADVHEIDHTSVVHDAVYKIAQPTAQYQTPGNDSGEWHRLNKENNRQGKETQGREYLKEKDS
jgi:hypothetical protein